MLLVHFGCCSCILGAVRAHRALLVHLVLRKVIKTAGLQLGGSTAILGLPPSPRLGGMRAEPGPWRPNSARGPASAPPGQTRPWRPRRRLRSLRRGGSKARMLIGRLRSAPSRSANPRAPFASSPLPPQWSLLGEAAAGPGQSAQSAGNSKPRPGRSQWGALRPASSQSGSRRGYKGWGM